MIDVIGGESCHQLVTPRIPRRTTSVFGLGDDDDDDNGIMEELETDNQRTPENIASSFITPALLSPVVKKGEFIDSCYCCLGIAQLLKMNTRPLHPYW